MLSVARVPNDPNPVLKRDRPLGNHMHFVTLETWSFRSMHLTFETKELVEAIFEHKCVEGVIK